VKVRYTLPPARVAGPHASGTHVMPPRPAVEPEDGTPRARPTPRAERSPDRATGKRRATPSEPTGQKLPKLLPRLARLGRSPSIVWGCILALLVVALAILPRIPIPGIASVPILQGAVADHATGCTWHTVEVGETLSQLSADYDITAATIARANQLKVTDSIRVDQRLCIPLGSGTLGQEGAKADPAKYGSAYGVDDFIKFVLPYARRAHDDTGWPLSVILAQWGLEQGWQTPRFTGYNWGNCGAVPDEPMVPGTSAPGSPDHFAYAPAPEDGLRIYLHVAHLHYYTAIAPAAKQGADAAAKALGASPWDAGHYTNRDDPGSSLLALMQDFNLYRYDK
jgi:hypothetical protein